MGWKYLPYWLKCGIAIGTIGLIIGILALLLRDIFNNSFLQVLNFPSFVIALGMCYEKIFCYNSIYIIISFFCFFIIGVIIGLIYRKIKSK